MKNEKTLLENLGATNIILKNLVNNYYYKFDFNGNNYTLAHTLNVYGASVDYWELSSNKQSKTFDSLEQVIDFLGTHAK